MDSDKLMFAGECWYPISTLHLRLKGTSEAEAVVTKTHRLNATLRFSLKTYILYTFSNIRKTNHIIRGYLHGCLTL